MRISIIGMQTLILWLCISVSAMSSEADTTWSEYRLFKAQPVADRVSREMTVRVGQSGATSHIDFSLWRGESSMRVSLGDVKSSSVFPTTQEVFVSSDHRGHRIYEVPGGLEWEIILPGRPETNVFRYDIKTDNLVFFRQDSLSTFEKNILGAHRPDSVVGAYVAYHSSKVHNRRVINGVDTVLHEYETGQAFVVYRPRAWDGVDTIWCDLSINQRDGYIEVRVNSRWLDSASYPVTIDPTFGNTSVGASSLSWNQLYAYCHALTGINTYTVPSGMTATLSSYSVYGSETGAGDLSINLAGFSISEGYPETRLDNAVSVTVSGGTPGWYNSAEVSQALASGTEYGMAVGCAPRAGGIIYYNSVTNAAATDNADCTLGSETWTQSTVTNFNFSMYATFTEEQIVQEGYGRRGKVSRKTANEGRGE